MKACAVLLIASMTAAGFPLDGFKRTGIRRLEGYRLVQEGKVRGTARVPSGGRLPESQMHLRLTGDGRGFRLAGSIKKDERLQKGLESIFSARDRSYGIAVLDITNPAQPKYAAVREEFRQLPGSIGKILVASAFFNELAKVYPRIEDRERLMRETIRAADEFIITDGKTVPFFNPGDPAVVNRQIRIGDRFSVWEWLDHMLSQSSNAAGSFVWKETMLLRKFGGSYPPSKEDEQKFLRETPKAELGKLSVEVIEEAERKAGVDSTAFRLGTMFTRRASSIVPGASSYGTPFEMLRWLVRLEQGGVVDEWSSLEIKKLLYFARPRYRYAASPSLTNAAVFFKSGSFFQCRPEAGFKCGQYKGNETNIMNSIAIVESGSKVYLVSMMSNVLKINSASEHMAIAGLIERLIQSLP